MICDNLLFPKLVYIYIYISRHEFEHVPLPRSDWWPCPPFRAYPVLDNKATDRQAEKITRTRVGWKDSYLPIKTCLKHVPFPEPFVTSESMALLSHGRPSRVWHHALNTHSTRHTPNRGAGFDMSNQFIQKTPLLLKKLVKGKGWCSYCSCYHRNCCVMTKV